jgi:uncharacterized protein YjbI with pentapeptide repeats
MKRLSDFSPLNAAEERMLSGCLLGDRVSFGDGDLPIEDSEDTILRADLIRLLLLGQDPDVVLHAKGIRLRGAYISGALDLQGGDCAYDLTLTRCVLEKAPSFINARMRGLHLSGCDLPGMHADNCIFDGSVFLRSGLISRGEISLPSARISGDLQICDARIEGANGVGIFAASVKIEGSVYLGDYPFDDTETELHVDSAAQFSSAKISGDFYCRNCAISAGQNTTISAFAADDGLQSSPTALSLNRTEVGGVLHLRNNQITRGMVNLSGAVVRRLNDEPTGVSAGYRVRLDGFEYQTFSDQADTKLEARLDWLERRPQGVGFSAQPYEHLAAVFNKMGHRDDAQNVLRRKERDLREANMQAIRESGHGLWKIPFLWLSSGLLRWLVGYGYRPILAMGWGILLIILLSLASHKTWQAGDMTPNSAPILVSANWVFATQTHPQNPGAFWSMPGQAGQDYETFHPVAYATDLLIPIVNLGQEDAWAPSTSRSVWGQRMWWLRWFAKGFGWVITALAAAAVTGVIRRV